MAFVRSARGMAALPLGVLAAVTRAAETETRFSTNAICTQINCVNPIFPAMMELGKNDAMQWQCQNTVEAQSYMGFCKDAIAHPVAVPSPNTSESLFDVVQQQDDRAATQYFYHLAGLNLEAWDFKEPEKSTNQCVRAIWTMVCDTFFPKATSTCVAGEAMPYLRPCKNVCSNYVQACGVECCDEGVQCVFDHRVALLEGGFRTTTGYVDELGPSATCTGGAASLLGSTVRFLSTALALQLFLA